MRLGVGVALLLAAQPLRAEPCPTAADAARGVRVTFADGTTEVHRAAGAGLVVVAGKRPDGTRWTMDLAQGLFMLGQREVPEGRGLTLRFDYGREPESLPRPEPLGRFAIAATVTDGSTERMEVQTHRYGPLEQVTLGGCAYDAIEAQIAYGSPALHEEGLLWLPELGMGLPVWSGAPGGERRSNAPLALAPLP